MNITTTACNFNASPALNAFVRSQLKNALGRIESAIVAVDVFMEDINGPKGGVDKQALIRVHLRTRRVITIEARHEDLYAAIRNGVRRAKRAAHRHLRRVRRTRTSRIAELIHSSRDRVPST